MRALLVSYLKDTLLSVGNLLDKERVRVIDWEDRSYNLHTYELLILDLEKPEKEFERIKGHFLKLQEELPAFFKDGKRVLALHTATFSTNYARTENKLYKKAYTKWSNRFYYDDKYPEDEETNFDFLSPSFLRATQLDNTREFKRVKGIHLLTDEEPVREYFKYVDFFTKRIDGIVKREDGESFFLLTEDYDEEGNEVETKHIIRPLAQDDKKKGYVAGVVNYYNNQGILILAPRFNEVKLTSDLAGGLMAMVNLGRLLGRRGEKQKEEAQPAKETKGGKAEVIAAPIPTPEASPSKGAAETKEAVPEAAPAEPTKTKDEPTAKAAAEVKPKTQEEKSMSTPAGKPVPQWVDKYLPSTIAFYQEQIHQKEEEIKKLRERIEEYDSIKPIFIADNPLFAEKLRSLLEKWLAFFVESWKDETFSFIVKEGPTVKERLLIVAVTAPQVVSKDAPELTKFLPYLYEYNQDEERILIVGNTYRDMELSEREMQKSHFAPEVEKMANSAGIGLLTMNSLRKIWTRHEEKRLDSNRIFKTLLALKGPFDDRTLT